MNKNKPRKLVVNRETMRSIGGRDLGNVRGASYATGCGCSVVCDETAYTCLCASSLCPPSKNNGYSNVAKCNTVGCNAGG
jgi:hypothetical protein